MALFAMRCVRELGLPLRHGCRLIMGTDEVRLRRPALLLLPSTPRAEHLHAGHGLSGLQRRKGHVPTRRHPDLGDEEVLPRVASIDGGFRINVLPSDAQASVLGLDAAEVLKYGGAAASRCGVVLRLRHEGAGRSSPSMAARRTPASPWEGVNG